MNRRGFLSTMGAAIAGALLGGKVESDPLQAKTFVGDDVYFGSFNGNLDLLTSWGEPYTITVTNEGLSFPPGGIRRIDGLPLDPGDLYIDASGVIQLRADAAGPMDPSWYDAWL